jgi:hypothetical protein
VSERLGFVSCSAVPFQLKALPAKRERNREKEKRGLGCVLVLLSVVAGEKSVSSLPWRSRCGEKGDVFAVSLPAVFFSFQVLLPVRYYNLSPIQEQHPSPLLQNLKKVLGFCFRLSVKHPSNLLSMSDKHARNGTLSPSFLLRSYPLSNLCG